MNLRGLFTLLLRRAQLIAVFGMLGLSPAFAAVAIAPEPSTAPAEPMLEAAPTDPNTGRMVVPWAKVAQALARKDVGEAQRLAFMVPSAQWQAALTPGQSNASATATALTVLPDSLGAHVWLPYLGLWILSGAPEHEPLAKQSMLLAGALLDLRDPAALHAWEVAEATVADVCGALLWVAGTTKRALPLRLSALEAVVRSRGACPLPPLDLAADAHPEIRQAMVAVLPATGAAAAVLQARLDDDVPAVASAAAARLCQTAKGTAPDDRALRLARQYVVAPEAIEDSVELLECLARSTVAEDHTLLQSLGRNAGPALRQRANELLLVSK